MRVIVNAIVLILFAMSFSSESFAHDKEKPLKLDLDYLKFEALHHSPDLVSQKNQLEAALAEIEQEGLPANPQLSGSLYFPQYYPDERGDNEFEIQLSQTLRMGDFGKRGLISNLISKEKSIDNQLQLLKTMQQISFLYYRIWGLQEVKKRLEELKVRAGKLKESVDSLSEMGRVDEKDKAIILASVAKINAKQEDVNFQIGTATASLTEKVGRDVRNIHTFKPKLKQNLGLADVKALAERSEIGVLKRTQLRAEIAAEQHELARSETFPALTPSIMWAHNDAGTDFFGVGLSFELPVFQRNGAEKARARAAMNEAQTVSEYISSGAFDSELEAAFLRMQSKKKQAEIFDGQVKPQLFKALEAARAQYEGGQVSIFELWQLEKEYTESFDKALELWIDAYAALGDLELLVGSQL